MSDDSKDLLLGPYLGEFGWELTHWNPYARFFAEGWREKHKADLSSRKVIVAARPDREWWYEDFADEFFPIPDVDIRHARGPKPRTKLPLRIKTFWKDSGYTGLEVIPTQHTGKIGHRWGARRWRDLSLSGGRPSLIILHARDLPGDANRNGIDHREWWEDLPYEMEAAGIDLSRVATIGHRDGSLSHDQIIDCRGMELKALGKLISAAAVVIGPSSGPMHLAQLCKTPVIVWGNRAVNHLFVPGPADHAGKANPFEVETRFFLSSDTFELHHSQWKMPPHDWVTGQIRELLENRDATA